MYEFEVYNKITREYDFLYGRTYAQALIRHNLEPEEVIYIRATYIG